MNFFVCLFFIMFSSGLIISVIILHGYNLSEQAWGSSGVGITIAVLV